MKPSVLVVVAALALVGVPQASASTLYVVHDAYDFGGFAPSSVMVDGTITTDGHLGILGQADILDWSLTISSLITLTPANSDLSLQGNSLSVVGIDLLWNYDLPAGQLVFSSPGVAGINGFVSYSTGAFSALAGFCAPDVSDCLGPLPADLRTGVSVIGVDPPPTVTPIPSGLPLFISGLGALGLLGWLRKWKNAGGAGC